jgi:hypothetical protein
VSRRTGAPIGTGRQSQVDRGEVRRARLAAALSSVMAVMLAALLGHGPARAGPATSDACAELAGLARSLDLMTLADLVTIRSSAARFAVALSEQSAAEAAAGDPAAAGHAEVVAEVQDVLAGARSTAEQLAGAVMPVARQCGVPLASAG